MVYSRQVKSIWVVFLILFSGVSYGQFDGIELSLGHVQVYHPESPGIENMPHQVAFWRAIDVEFFESDTRDKPFIYKLPIAFTLNSRFITNKDNQLNIGLSYNNVTRSTDDNGRLRYSDMVDPTPDGGFVSPSSYVLDMGHFQYHALGVNASFLHIDYIGKLKHRVGLGLNIQRMLSSSYFLNHTHSSTKEKYDYQDKDLTFSDNFWVIQPFGQVAFQICKVDNSSFWIYSRFSFDFQERPDANLIGHLWSNGLVVEMSNLRKKSK